MAESYPCYKAGYGGPRIEVEQLAQPRSHDSDPGNLAAESMPFTIT